MLWEVETDSYCFPGRITDLKKISPCGIWCCIDWCFYNKIMGIKLPLIEYYENDGPREKNCLLANGCTRQLFRLWINSALDLCPRAYLWTAHQALMWIKKKKTNKPRIPKPEKQALRWCGSSDISSISSRSLEARFPSRAVFSGKQGKSRAHSTGCRVFTSALRGRSTSSWNCWQLCVLLLPVVCLL